MSTPFLVRFAESLVGRLLAAGLLELRPGAAVDVVSFLAERLAEAPSGSSLLSTVEKALLACPDVIELYADLDTLKAEVEALRA